MTGPWFCTDERSHFPGGEGMGMTGIGLAVVSRVPGDALSAGLSAWHAGVVLSVGLSVSAGGAFSTGWSVWGHVMC